MSNRTIMEFNHDRAHEIEANPEDFLECLGAVMRGLDREAMERLEIRYGVTVGRTRHHSDRMSEEVKKLFGGREP